MNSRTLAFAICGFIFGLAPGIAQANKISDEDPLSQEQVEELKSLGLPMFEDNWSEEHGGLSPGKIIEITDESKRKHRGDDEKPRGRGRDESGEHFFPQLSVEEIQAARTGSRDERERETEDDAQVERIIDHVPSGRSFRCIVNREQLRQISKAAEPRLQREMDQSPQLSDEELAQEEEVLKGWSDGVDDRVLKAMFNGHSKQKYGMIADFDLCTANVLKARSGYVWPLTATHCVYQNDEGDRYNFRLRPRREFNEAPYGEWKMDTVIRHSQFFENECASNFTAPCVKWDMALVRFKPGKGAKVPPTMRWGLRSESFLEGRTKFRRGYPGCGVLGAPGDALNPCKTNVLYGDGSFDIGASYYPDGDGWNRAIDDYSSDSSFGDSGSGCFYINDDNRFTVFGVVSAGLKNCYAGCPEHTPSTMRRITPVWYDTINANL